MVIDINNKLPIHFIYPICIKKTKAVNSIMIIIFFIDKYSLLIEHNIVLINLFNKYVPQI